MLTERQPVDAADRREVLRGFGSDLHAGGRSPATLDSMAIEERIKADLSAAAKAQDRPRVSALRLLIDSLQKEAKQAQARPRRAG